MISYIGMVCPMTSNESELRHSRPSPLPAGWSGHACLDLVNSRWQDHLGSGRTFDRLALPTWQEAFLGRWRLGVEEPAGPGVLRELDALRSLIRRLLEAFGRGAELPAPDVEALNRVMAASTSARLLERDTEGYRLVSRPPQPGWRWAMGEIATSAAALLAAGEPARLKVCGNHACTWMFYDSSRNRSRRWCDGGVCGNLLKVRRHRARTAGRRGTPASPPDG